MMGAYVVPLDERYLVLPTRLGDTAATRPLEDVLDAYMAGDVEPLGVHYDIDDARRQARAIRAEEQAANAADLRKVS